MNDELHDTLKFVFIVVQVAIIAIFAPLLTYSTNPNPPSRLICVQLSNFSKGLTTHERFGHNALMRKNQSLQPISQEERSLNLSETLLDQDEYRPMSRASSLLSTSFLA